MFQAVIILHSRRLPNSDIPRENEGDISLDQIPDMTNAQLQSVLEASTAASSATLLPGVCLVRPRRLGEEAERLFSGLLDLPMRGKTGNKPISPPVMEDVMDCLVRIAKQRPQFMDRVVQSFETVHGRLAVLYFLLTIINSNVIFCYLNSVSSHSANSFGLPPELLWVGDEHNLSTDKSSLSSTNEISCFNSN
ncbi:hypothetical protein CSKR_200022 [Clonorchis sinensis]|uniref:Symplekin/Pta1 N-terminal domain-containing protein n=1 Tax=Clonorchis sinensis TaxID=79923 RepID=A0A8T1LYN9_CLOSI|nr:hypothetical protein CSKR_200022 [Clonorchis sinensis]